MSRESLVQFKGRVAITVIGNLYNTKVVKSKLKFTLGEAFFINISNFSIFNFLKSRRSFFIFNWNSGYVNYICNIGLGP